MVNAIYCLDSGLIWICQKPDLRSRDTKWPAPTSDSNASCIHGSGKESFLVQLFNLQKSIQRDKLPPFFLTNTTTLHHRDWLGLITPESNMSLRVFCTSPSRGGGILQNLSLYGLRSVRLITCSIVLVYPNSFSSRMNILCYSIRSSLAALASSLSQTLSHERSNFCICFFLHLEMDILGLLIPCISSKAFIMLGLSCEFGISLVATTLANAMPLFRMTDFPVVICMTTRTLLLPSLKLV